METRGNLKNLVDGVRAKAEAEAESIQSRARKVAERNVASARELAATKKTRAAADAAVAVSARREAALAELALNERRAVMTRQEQLVQDIFAAALERLKALDDATRRPLVARLLREAVEALASPKVVVRLNAADAALTKGDALFTGVEDVRAELDPEPLNVAGGVVVSDESGRRVYENTFEARLERRREALRTLVAEELGLAESQERT